MGKITVGSGDWFYTASSGITVTWTPGATPTLSVSVDLSQADLTNGGSVVFAAPTASSTINFGLSGAFQFALTNHSGAPLGAFDLKLVNAAPSYPLDTGSIHPDNYAHFHQVYVTTFGANESLTLSDPAGDPGGFGSAGSTPAPSEILATGTILNGATVLGSGMKIHEEEDPGRDNSFTLFITETRAPGPKVSSFVANGSASVGAGEALSYTITFSEDVTGVDASKFALGASNTAVASGPLSVVALDARTYKVSAGAAVSPGTFRLEFTGANVTSAIGVAYADGVVQSQALMVLSATATSELRSAETLFNPTTTGDQGGPRAVTLSDGRALALFSDQGVVKGRFLDPSGRPLGGDFVVVSTPNVTGLAALANGGAVVGWIDGGNANLQVLDAVGHAVGRVIVAYTADSGSFSHAIALSLAELPNGGFAVAVANGSASPIFNTNIYNYYNFLSTSLYDATGARTGVTVQQAFALNMPSTDFGAALTATASGFAAAWSDAGGGSHLQRYAQDGSTLGADVALASYGPKTLATLASGRIVSAWASGSLVFAQVYDPGTATTGPVVQADTGSLASAVSDAAVTALRNGGFLVSWTAVQGADGGDVEAEEFAANGSAVGTRFQVNTIVAGVQGGSALAAVGDGSVAALWTDGSNMSVPGQPVDTSGTGVKLQDLAFRNVHPPTSDFNGDGRSDILWRSTTNGDTALWNSTGSGGFTGQDLGVVDKSWQISQVGDFNGDGRPDILWRSTTNGDTALWNSTVSGGFTGQDLGVVDKSWQISQVGDFNGDERSDILWRSTTNGDTALWNSTVSGGFTGQDLGVVDKSWQISQVGDFNGDGRSDILWRSTTNGDTALWNSTVSGGFTGKDLGVVDNSWQISQVGDFNGDGRPDILWRSTTNGDTALWNSTVSGGFTGQDLGVVDNSWQISQVGDFNGDGRSDILWRSTTNGDTALWNSTVSGGFTGHDLGVVDTSWAIQRT